MTTNTRSSTLVKWKSTVHGISVFECVKNLVLILFQEIHIWHMRTRPALYY